MSYIPWRPWELLSGGMDNTLIRWDTSRGRILSKWDTSLRRTNASETNNKDEDTLDESSSSLSCELFNPPFVHDIAIAASWRTSAIACGDGTILMTKLGGKKSGAPRQDDVFVLGRESGGHVSSVSTVSYICNDTVLLSGGNDKNIIIWPNISQQEYDATNEKDIKGYQSLHSKKINKICALPTTSCSTAKFVVTDTSSCASLYDIH